LCFFVSIISDYRRRRWLDLPQVRPENTSLGPDAFNSRRTLGKDRLRARDRVQSIATGTNLALQQTLDTLRPEESVVHGGKRAISGRWLPTRTNTSVMSDETGSWGTPEPLPDRMSHSAFVSMRSFSKSKKTSCMIFQENILP
jgi:hypothetical protein